MQSVRKTAWLTALALLAFAANSLLCRAALGQGSIDAASFTSLRVVSGALTLGLIVLPRWRDRGLESVDWRSAAMLFAYMVFFAFAYRFLAAGTGALILFGAVQLTMFVVALRAGEPFPLLSWVGLVLAILGLVYLVSPGLTAPHPLGAALMAAAGIAWGVYSLLGRGAADPLAATANNFLYSVPLVLAVNALFLVTSGLHATWRGVGLAVLSGAITSGLGYVIWYAALRGLTGTHAATIQLAVPVIAALGAVLLLSEPITPRLALAAAMTLGGVWMALATRRRRTVEAARSS